MALYETTEEGYEKKKVFFRYTTDMCSSFILYISRSKKGGPMVFRRRRTMVRCFNSAPGPGSSMDEDRRKGHCRNTILIIHNDTVLYNCIFILEDMFIHPDLQKVQLIMICNGRFNWRPQLFESLMI